MNDVRERATAALMALPIVHRITLVAVGIGLVMATIAFSAWISTPEMTILASGLDDADLAQVVDELEAGGIAYEIGNGGAAVMVRRDELYTTRARMATAGITTGDAEDGWAIVDDSGIAVNQEQMEINIQRAMEGELSRTLTEMEGIEAATVHLVRPEERLFTEQQEPTTASVLLDTRRDLGPDEIEAVVFLVSSAVEGLETGGITVADVNGTVLHAPGDAGGATVGASRQLRQTRDYEQALAGDIQRLLTVATGSTASVVVRATLDFDETMVSQRILDPASQVAISEQDISETYEGVEPTGTGIVGVDGGPVEGGDTEATTDYERSEILREYGISETTTTTTQAPGRVEGLSVAIVMDDGTTTGAAVPAEDEVADLVAAAVGLDANRGDSVAVTSVAFPEPVAAEAAGGGLAATAVDMASRVGAIVVFIVVAVALFLMSRRRDGHDETAELDPGAAADRAALAADQPARLAQGDGGHVYAIENGQRVLVADAVPSADAVALGRRTPPTPPVPPDDTARREVEALVERQPEAIANLLRGWLADAT